MQILSILGNPLSATKVLRHYRQIAHKLNRILVNVLLMIMNYNLSPDLNQETYPSSEKSLKTAISFSARTT